MKTYIKKISVNTILFFATLGVSVLIFSCHGDPINPDLEVETLVENFTANGAVSVDKNGIIYVSEYGRFVDTGGSGTRVFKVSPGGKIIDTIQGLSGPMGTAKDSKGNLYVNNANNTINGQVLKITPNGERQVIATIDGWPSSMAIDKNDNLYISNYTAPTVHKITARGELEVYATDPRLAGGVGIDIDSSGNIIVGNFYTADIFSINQERKLSLIATIPNIVIQNFGIGYLTVINDVIFATGIAVNYIYKVTLDGEIETFAGNGQAAQIDGPLLEASFSNPNGISVNKRAKILYVSEYTGAGGLRKIEL